MQQFCGYCNAFLPAVPSQADGTVDWMATHTCPCGRSYVVEVNTETDPNKIEDRILFKTAYWK